MKTVGLRDLQHSQVDCGSFVAREPDVANLTRLLSVYQRFQRAAFIEEAVRIFHTNVLVKLK
jgi:hypothetical protein